MDLRKYAKWSLKAMTHQKQRVSQRAPQTRFLEVSNANSKFPALPNKKKLASVDIASALSLQEGDLVRVLFGKETGSEGVIKRILRKDNQVIVERCNMKRVSNRSGPISREAPIHVLNVVPLDPVLKQPTRIKSRYDMSGRRVRISKLSRCAMPRPVPVRTQKSEKLNKSDKPVKKKNSTAQGLMLAAVSERLRQLSH